MPPQRAIRYKNPVSKMLKAELQQLCQHFHIPVEGNVIDLRKRLNTYLKAHEDDLRGNRNFAALYPQRRGRNQPRIPTPSDGSDSEPDNNYPAWDGINNAQEINPVPAPHHSPTPEPVLNGVNDEEDNMDLIHVNDANDENYNMVHDPSPSPEPIQNPELRVIAMRGPKHRSRSLTQSSGK